MADSARNYTDNELKAMEEYLSGIYAQAEKDLIKKFNKYTADFVRLDAEKQKMVDSGEMSPEEYETWRKNKLLYGMHWTRLIDQVKKEMGKCNQTALDYVNGRVPQIFSVNYNQIAESIPGAEVAGYSFELINADTVRNIATNDGIMLPPPRKEMNIPKDEMWNSKLVNAQLLQGILQGESIPKMAARMANVCNSNKAAAIRTARTMTTAAENSGRQSGINRATADGIILIKEWLATNDERTRESHIAINHERIRCDAGNTKKRMFSNGLEFPGDWNGKPAEVYNCRCTLITRYAGVDRKMLKKAIQVHADSDNAALLKKNTESKQIEKNNKTAFENLKLYDILKKTIGIDIIKEDIFYMDSKMFRDQVEQLRTLEERFNIIHRSTVTIGYEYLKNNAFAVTTSARILPRSNKLLFNPLYYSDKKHYDSEIDEMFNGYFMPCNKSERTKYIVSHEYGHMLFNYLLQNEYERLGWDSKNPDKFVNDKALTKKGKYKWYTKAKKNYAMQCTKEIIAIAKKNNPNFDINKNISDYAQKKDAEFMAEAFANSQLGRPNEIGLAMQQWLKEKGF